MTFSSDAMHRTFPVKEIRNIAAVALVANFYWTTGFAGELHNAVKAKDKPGIEKALAAGADLEETDFMIGPALHVAVSAGDIDTADYLIARGADLNSVGELHGSRPVHISAEFGDVKMVELLIGAGSDIEAQDGDGRTPLFRAAANGQTSAVEVLLAKGADVDARESRLQQTPLHRAAENGNTDVVELLIESSADVNAVDRSGNSPFSLAAQAQSFSNVGDGSLLALLLANGADPQIKNSHGQTPLEYAKSRSEGTWGDIVEALEQLQQK